MGLKDMWDTGDSKGPGGAHGGHLAQIDRNSMVLR